MNMRTFMKGGFNAGLLYLAVLFTSLSTVVIQNNCTHLSFFDSDILCFDWFIFFMSYKSRPITWLELHYAYYWWWFTLACWHTWNVINCIRKKVKHGINTVSLDIFWHSLKSSINWEKKILYMISTVLSEVSKAALGICSTKDFILIRLLSSYFTLHKEKIVF